MELTAYQWDMVERAVLALETIAMSAETYGPYNICEADECGNNVEKGTLCHQHKL